MILNQYKNYETKGNETTTSTYTRIFTVIFYHFNNIKQNLTTKNLTSK